MRIKRLALAALVPIIALSALAAMWRTPAAPPPSCARLAGPNGSALPLPQSLPVDSMESSSLPSPS